MVSSPVLQRILDRTVDNTKIFGAAFCIRYGDDVWSGGAGNLTPDTRHFIASTTKLFVTAVVLQLEAEGRIAFDDPIAGYLDPEILRGLHVLSGREYSGSITVRDLLAHTSGLPDYFEDKNSSGRSLEEALFSGEDRSWSFDEAVALSKTMRPRFRPGAKGRAHYSDTNYQLLGRILEVVCGRPAGEVFERSIIDPLGLKRTYLYTDEHDNRPLSLYYRKRPLPIPKAMASFGPDGGSSPQPRRCSVLPRRFLPDGCFRQSGLPRLRAGTASSSPSSREWGSTG